MNRALLVALWAICALHVHPAIAHEVRPAYLEIIETSSGVFDTLWKQPAAGGNSLPLEPELSNGLLDEPPDEIHFVGATRVERWAQVSMTTSSFSDTTLRIRGLENTITDVFVSVRSATGQQLDGLLTPSKPTMRIQLAAPSKNGLWSYLHLGIEHILAGVDHLALVLGLLMLISERRLLLRTITSFTAGHSLTLAAVATGHIRLAGAIVEPLIALSVMFVAAEIVNRYRNLGNATTQNPCIVAFGVGLLHGFGFAGALIGVGFPDGLVLEALFLFNCGIEIGQLVFIGAILVLAQLCRSLFRMSLNQHLQLTAAYALGTVSCYWLFERAQPAW